MLRLPNSSLPRALQAIPYNATTVIAGTVPPITSRHLAPRLRWLTILAVATRHDSLATSKRGCSRREKQRAGDPHRGLATLEADQVLEMKTRAPLYRTGVRRLPTGALGLTAGKKPLDRENWAPRSWKRSVYPRYPGAGFRIISVIKKKILIFHQSLSTLHKQNFDLKLELYHRRGRQDALEARNAKLEDERAEMTEIHDNLLAELERRDQALNEAIQLVMDLENQISDLALERKLIRQAEADGLSCNPCEDDAMGGRSATPKAMTRPNAQSDSDDRGLERMPSFMDEQSEQTKTLRSVVLDKKRSLSHLRKVSGSSAAPSDLKGVTSPSLVSLLSESSFLSIYGDGGDRDGEGVLPPSIQLQSPSDASLGLMHQQDKQRGNTAPRSASSGTFNGGSSPSTRAPAVVSLLDMTSPLQQIEQLERSYTNRRHSAKRMASSCDGAVSESPNMYSSPTAPSNPTRSREAKTDAQRRVMTSTPTGKNATAHRALPPTPDTVSTSTLRRFRDPENDVSSRTSSFEFFRRPSSDRDGEEAVRHASMAASTGRREMLTWQVGADKSALSQRLVPLLPPAPRSVGETDSTQDRSSTRPLRLEPRDGGADGRSEDSQFDYWMWEGARARDQSPSDRDNDSLPDLFEVPGTDALFGAIRGSGFSPAPGLGRASQDGGLASSSSDSELGELGPTDAKEADVLVAPGRRSSQRTRVGSFTNCGGAPVGESCGQNSARENRWLTSRRGRSRSSSADAASFCSQHMQSSCAPGTRRSPYPPIAGQPARSRGLSGLNGLFRRESTSDARCPSPRQQKAQQSPHQCSRSGRMSVPPPAARPWDRRLPELSDDDRASATPPPIMRQRAPRRVSTSGDAPAASNVGRMQDQDFECAVRPRTATGLDSGGGDMAATPPKRSRWLGLGLIGGLKKGTV